MRVPGWTALAVAVAACQSAAAMSRDETTVAGVTVFTVGEHDDMVEAGTARYGEDGSVYPVPWFWD